MRIDQALFGEVRNRAHGVIAASGQEPVARAAVLRTDLPAQAPSGAPLPPFMSGFSIRDRFILARTAPDPTATRAGMVRTHALILDHADLPQDITPLIQRLRDDPPDSTAIEAFEFTEDATAAPTSELLRPAADALVSGRGPVVVGGPAEDFETLVAALWARLTPELRRAFSFRVTFGRRDLQGSDPPDLAWALPNAATTFDLMSTAAPETLSPGAALLAGEAEGALLLDLASELEISPASFAEIDRLGVILSESSAPSVANVANALRITNGRSPDPTSGVPGKTRLLNRLIEVLRVTGIDGLSPLRNLSVPGFQIEPLWREVSTVVAAIDGQGDDWISVLHDANEPDGALPDWKAAVWRGWVRVRPSEAVMDRLLSGFKDRTMALADVVRRLPGTTAWDEAIAARLERDDIPAAEEAEPLRLALETAPRPRAHAVLASRLLPLEEAVDRQLRVAGTDGLDLVLRQAGPGQLIDLAVAKGDSRLVEPAARAAVVTGRLGARPMAHATVQRIWSTALNLDPEAWASPSDPPAAARTILTEHAAGRPVALDLINQLALSPLADLSGWENRASVWASLPQPALGHFLTATAGGWLDALAQGEAATDLEPELADIVLAPAYLDARLSRWAVDNHPAALRLFELAPTLDDDVFNLWISKVLAVNTSLTSTVAADIGALVLKRRWSKTADALLYAWIRGWPQLKTTLDTCGDLLPWYQRWRFNLRQPTESEVWSAAEEIVCELYKGGPDQGGLWERAGGRGAELMSQGTGQDRWRAALGRMRQGGGVKPERLVREMLKDYKHNEPLGLLARQAPFKPQ